MHFKRFGIPNPDLEKDKKKARAERSAPGPIALRARGLVASPEALRAFQVVLHAFKGDLRA